MPEETTDQVPVAKFMVLRAPGGSPPTGLHRHWIRDDLLVQPPRTHVPPPDANSITVRSAVAAMVHRHVFCTPGSTVDTIIDALIEDLPAAEPRCGEAPDSPQATLVAPLVIEDLERTAYLEENGVYRLLPTSLERYLGRPLVPELMRAIAVLDAAAEPFNPAALRTALAGVFGRPLHEVVYTNQAHSSDFRDLKRLMYDALYRLYILRRRIPVNLEGIIDGLAALHTLEALAVDGLYEIATRGRGAPSSDERQLLAALANRVSQLRDWDGKQTPGMPLIPDLTELNIWLRATPIVHPLISQLFWFKRPFNNVKPIGVGDLKVVKQWLEGYEVGEIAYIENVLQGEQRVRVHRTLEKSEETLTFASEQSSETSRDTQTTDRFELKREVEQVINSDTSVNTGLSLTAEGQAMGYKVVAGVTGGFAYARSSTDSTKLASNFARDVVDQAVSRVQDRRTQTRTTVSTFETMERNEHTFDNRGDNGHISGIYRWVDKRYTSQVFNFGKRMMFEFVLPEPAAFFVQSVMASYASSLNVPQQPTEPVRPPLPQWLESLDPASINEAEFRQYSAIYDLADMEFPARTRRVDLVDQATGRNYFSQRGLDSAIWLAHTYTCRPDSQGYRIRALNIEGYIHFWGRDESDSNEQNTLRVSIDGSVYVNEVNNQFERWVLTPGSGGRRTYSAPPDPSAPPALSGESIDITLGFWDIANYYLSLNLELELDGEVLKNFQQKVYNRIRTAEQVKLDAFYEDAYQTWLTDMANYRRRLDELRATVIGDLISGQTEQANRRLVLRELKRQCLSMLTKEMDADGSDDKWTDKATTGTRPSPQEVSRFTVTEATDNSGKVVTTAKFASGTYDLDIVVPKLSEAREKGTVIQFLEQAFEWQQLSYLPYPYFWAQPNRWVELMTRRDRTDPFFTDFLQAGAVRVLLAAAPAYNDAVLHFLATGEPWAGGPSPAIGDPLFIPLYEELRDTQDDLANAVPEGEPWQFTLPTSLVYLENSSTPLPTPGGAES